jgi:hypothetical protein
MDCLPHLHLAAYHAAPGYRGDTPGIGVLCRQADWLAGAGVFSNSIGQASKYAVAGWQPWRIGPVRVGAYAGVIDGYRYKNSDAFPFAAGLLSLPIGHAELHLSLLPQWRDISPATVGLSITWRLN